MEYGIGVRNRYELFYDEIGDPLELIAKQEEERRKAQAEKKSKALENKNKDAPKPVALNQKSISAATAAAKESVNNNNNNKTPQQAGQKNRENRLGPNPERRIQRDEPDSNRKPGDERRHRKPQDGQDNRRFNDKDGKRTRPLRGPRRESEKEFINREKRGTDKTPAGESTSAGNLKPETATDEESQEKPVEEPVAETAETHAEPAEPEITEMTLEQWKKEMEARKSKAAYDASIRKPNEGEHSELQWDKMTRIKKINKQKDLDCLPHGPLSNSTHSRENQEDNLDEEDRKLKRLEETLSKQFHFSDNRGGSSTGVGGRSGRGARGTGYGRGGRGGSSGGGASGASNASGRDRGEPRENRGRGNRAHNVHLNGPPRNPTPRVEDLNDFPSLAA